MVVLTGSSKQLLFNVCVCVVWRIFAVTGWLSEGLRGIICSMVYTSVCCAGSGYSGPCKPLTLISTIGAAIHYETLSARKNYSLWQDF